jgi:hypothetical protein
MALRAQLAAILYFQLLLLMAVVVAVRLQAAQVAVAGQ